MPERSPVTLKLLRYLPDAGITPLRGLLIGSGCTAVALLVRALIDPLVEGVPFVTLFPMLVVATVWGGIWAGASTLLIGTVIGTYTWIPPWGSFDVTFSRAATALSFVLSGGVIVGAIYFIEQAVAAMRRSEARSAIIAGEMQHRVKNVLQLVQSISKLTARDAASSEEYQRRLNERILALSRALEAPRSAPHLPVNLEVLLARLLEPFDMTNFTFQGPVVAVADETVSMLGLAVHELATNAAKYGALSVPTGMVTLTWHLEGRHARLEWEERGGPTVKPVTQVGFGTKLIQAALDNESGPTVLTYHPDGVRCVLRFLSAPLELLSFEGAEEAPLAAGRNRPSAPS